jgi:enamine deaminase RidA (YjgF/YER057c/UK114 family)
MAHTRLRSVAASSVYGDGAIGETCQLVRAGDALFLRGQTGLDLDHVFHGKGDAAAQADRAMRNVATLLGEAGAGLEHVTKVSIFLTDRAWRDAVCGVVGRHLARVSPALSVVVVGGLSRPEMLVAIDVDAVVGAPAKRHRTFELAGCSGAMTVLAGGELFVSGQIGVPLEGGPARGVGRDPEDAAAQADAALANLKTVVEEAGASLDDVCKITVQIEDRALRVPIYRTIGRYLRGVHAVSTGLIVNALVRPELFFQLDVSVVPQGAAKHRRLRKYHTDNTRYGVERQRIDCDFCQVVDTGPRIFLRGQTGQNLEDTLTDLGDAATQARQAMLNVETLLREAGSGLGEVCRAVVYATDRAHLAPAREAVLRHLAGVPCAMSEIIVKGLASPGLLMEVDIHAMRP